MSLHEITLLMRNGNQIDAIRALDGKLDVHVTDQTGELLEAVTVQPGKAADEIEKALRAGTFRLAKTCATCGGRFHAKRDAARYCSTSCKLKAARARTKGGAS